MVSFPGGLFGLSAAGVVGRVVSTAKERLSSSGRPPVDDEGARDAEASRELPRLDRRPRGHEREGDADGGSYTCCTTR